MKPCIYKDLSSVEEGIPLCNLTGCGCFDSDDCEERREEPKEEPEEDTSWFDRGNGPGDNY
jgi:hypothetical protein